MRRKVIFCLILLFLAQKSLANGADLIISEIMYDAQGSDSGREWVEVINLGQNSVTVSSTWRFFDGSNHNISFYQGTSTIASQELFILADKAEQFLLDYPDFSGNLFDTVMNLPNSSSSMAISYDSGITYATEVEYDSSWGGGDGLGLQLIDNIWQENCELGGTPGIINTSCQIEEVPEEEIIQNWEQLIINELLPNPVGSDDNEWIELYNQGPDTLNLEGLKIKDNSSRIFIVDADSELNLNLTANNYLLLEKGVTGISLNNSKGDAVIIMDNNENIIDQINYTDSAIEGRSYARSENYFVWTKTPSPGRFNEISLNKAPIAQISVEQTDFLVGEKISFSAESSYDPEGEDLDYLWKFGDGQTSSREKIKHQFESLGNFTINLTVTDSEGASDTTEFVLDIFPKKEEVKEIEKIEEEENIVMDLSEDDLIISEFIPNPKGSDDYEWIELYNASNEDINLNGWFLDDGEGGSKPYRFSSSTIIMAGDFLVLNREETKITLNNNSDQVRILNYEDQILQEVSYEKIPEAKSYAWDIENSEWFITDPSPGQINLKIIEPEIIYSVSEIQDLEKGQNILLEGIALNDSDNKSRSLYLLDVDNFQSLVEIYSHYKKFPEIKSGDLINVRGEISKLGDLPRIKIKTEEQVWPGVEKFSIKDPEVLPAEDLDEDFLGDYLSVKGVVVKKSGKSIYLAPGLEEEYVVRVYSKFSTKELGIKKGDEMIVRGIISETDNSFKLTPLSVNDISVSKSILGEKIEEEEVHVESAISTNISQINEKDKTKNIKTTLIITIIVALITLLIYFIKRRQQLT